MKPLLQSLATIDGLYRELFDLGLNAAQHLVNCGVDPWDLSVSVHPRGVNSITVTVDAGYLYDSDALKLTVPEGFEYRAGRDWSAQRVLRLALFAVTIEVRASISRELLSPVWPPVVKGSPEPEPDSAPPEPPEPTA